jgi:molybdenum cofactor cytidylyltransferase
MTTTPAQVWAIIAAAGMGRRFQGNSPKQLTRIRGRSMLAAVLDVLETSRVQGVVAVVNPNIIGAIRGERPENPRRAYVVNDRPEGQMIESVQMGLRKARELASATLPLPRSPAPAGCGFLITPGDHPSITTDAVDACLAAFASDPHAMVIATCSGRRGHPILLPADIAAEVLTWPTTEPLNRLRERYPDRLQYVDTGEPGVLVDIDTREDLERARLREDE